MDKIYLIVNVNSDEGNGRGPGETSIVLGGVNGMSRSGWMSPIKGQEYPVFTSREDARKYLNKLKKDPDLMPYEVAGLKVYELPIYQGEKKV